MGIPLTNEKPGEIKSPGYRWIWVVGKCTLMKTVGNKNNRKNLRIEESSGALSKMMFLMRVIFSSVRHQHNCVLEAAGAAPHPAYIGTIKITDTTQEDGQQGGPAGGESHSPGNMEESQTQVEKGEENSLDCRRRKGWGGEYQIQGKATNQASGVESKGLKQETLKIYSARIDLENTCLEEDV